MKIFSNVQYDPIAKAMNIKVGKGQIVDSDVKDNMILDYNKKGEIVNIEVLDFDLEKATKPSK